MADAMMPETGRELRSLVVPDGPLELSIETVSIGKPGPGEVVVRVEAAPINPTDLGLLLGPADPAKARVEDDERGRRLTWPLDDQQMAAMRPRLGLSLCPGLEGAGTVLAAGSGVEHLVGQTVAMFGGSMFADYRKISVSDCMIPPTGTSPEQAAALFVNPQTALGMMETVRREGRRALVLTAAASNLGHMINRVALADGIEVVNIVRRGEHVRQLHDLGAAYVCDSSAADFHDVLAGMIRATGATVAFDAIGGGPLASTILQAMEQVFAPSTFSIYGSTVAKKVYVYGRLDPRPLEVHGGTGMAWDVGGWLMMNVLATLGDDTVRQMRNRIVRERDTLFASSYAGAVVLDDLLDPERLADAARRASGGKYLLTPHRR